VTLKEKARRENSQPDRGAGHGPVSVLSLTGKLPLTTLFVILCDIITDYKPPDTPPDLQGYMSLLSRENMCLMGVAGENHQMSLGGWIEGLANRVR